MTPPSRSSTGKAMACPKALSPIIKALYDAAATACEPDADASMSAGPEPCLT